MLEGATRAPCMTIRQICQGADPTWLDPTLCRGPSLLVTAALLYNPAEKSGALSANWGLFAYVTFTLLGSYTQRSHFDSRPKRGCSCSCASAFPANGKPRQSALCSAVDLSAFHFSPS